jgi:hypothetical protein
MIFLKTFSILHVLITLWLLAIGSGFAMILNYQHAAGPAGGTPSVWPTETEIVPDGKLATLVLFVHPQCPCSRASLEELNRLLAKTRGKVATHVLFFKPEKFSSEWMRSDLWASASAMSDVAVREDAEGRQAQLFGVETSGFAVLYDANGKLLFSGGITGSRGHAGDNMGEDSIETLLNGNATAVNQTAVYGCPLLGNVCRPGVIAQ